MPSFKPLKSVAHSVAHHFASTLCYWKGDYAIHHLAAASKRFEAPIVEIDLLAQSAEPLHIQTGYVAEIIPYLHSYFLDLLSKEGFSVDMVIAAYLRYDFSVKRAGHFGLPVYDCVSSIKASNGHIYRAYLTESSN